MQPKKPLRAERLADAIHKELANIIVKFCQDPRIEHVTITNVKLSKDLSIARIYFTDFINPDSVYTVDTVKIKATLAALQKANNFLRSQLANKMSLRKVPELSFFYDENVIHGIKMDQLFAQINSFVPAHHHKNDN
jgi:ribosome-binding factor A